jgi:hypothetical protein
MRFTASYFVLTDPVELEDQRFSITGPFRLLPQRSFRG